MTTAARNWRLPLCTVLVVLAGCGASGAHYRPIVDGASGERFEADLAACQDVSRQREYLNADVRSSALIGAAFGALLGSDSLGEAAAGAGVVGVLSGARRAWEVRAERKQIIIECMHQRGHRVVG